MNFIIYDNSHHLGIKVLEIVKMLFHADFNITTKIKGYHMQNSKLI